jgi:hypothetical protein
MTYQKAIMSHTLLFLVLLLVGMLVTLSICTTGTVAAIQTPLSDVSGNNLTLINNNTQYVSAIKAYNFTSASRLYVLNNNLLQNNTIFTISMQVYPLGDGGGGLGRIFHKSAIGSTSLGVDAYYSIGASSIRFQWMGSTTQLRETTSTQLSNKWTLLTFVVNGTSVTDMYIYSNSSEVTYTTNTSGANLYNTSNTTFSIGNRESNDRYFNGYIKDVRVWNIKLTQDAISNLFLNQTVNLSNMVAWWPMVDCITPVDNYVVATDTNFCPGTYNIPDVDNNGVIWVDGSDFNVNGTGVTLVGAGSGKGIEIKGKNPANKNVTIYGFTVQNYTRGIRLNCECWSGSKHCNNISIINNSLIGNSVNIRNDGGCYDSFINNTISGCDGTVGSAGIGFNSVFTNTTQIYGNNIFGQGTCDQGINLDIGSNYALISNNYISGVDSGIKVGSSTSVTVINNYIYNATANTDAFNTGLHIANSVKPADSKCSRNVFINNTVDTFTKTGFLSQGCNDTQLLNNTFINWVPFANRSNFKSDDTTEPPCTVVFSTIWFGWYGGAQEVIASDNLTNTSRKEMYNILLSGNSYPTNHQCYGIFQGANNYTTDFPVNTNMSFTYPTALAENRTFFIPATWSGNLLRYKKATNVTHTQLTWNFGSDATTSTQFMNYTISRTQMTFTGFNASKPQGSTLLLNMLNAPYNDIYNVSTSSVLAYDQTSYSLTLSPGQQVIVGDYGSNLTFNTQSPPDINTSNLQNMLVNISYNLTNTTILDTFLLFYKTNSSVSNIDYYVNGTSYSGYFSKASLSNANFSYTFQLEDNNIFPAIYNYDEETMEQTSHTTIATLIAGQYIAVEFLNVSSTAQYNFFEIMANQSTGASATLNYYYCNSSYNWATSPTTGNCVSLLSESPVSNYNHCHNEPGGINSCHKIVPFAINTTTGSVGTVRVTPISYLIVEGQGLLSAVNVFGIANSTRDGATRYTTTMGTMWSNLTSTVDSHLHQFNGNSTFYYYAFANFTDGSSVNSSLRSDLLDLAGLPPDVFIASPIGISYKGNININATALSPNGYPIMNYTAYLLTNNSVLNKTLVNASTMNYLFDSTSASDGQYYIKIKACDSLDQCSNSTSALFRIDNTPPQFIQNLSDMNVPINTIIAIQLNVTDAQAITFGINDTAFTINQSGFINSSSAFSGIWNLNINATDGLSTTNMAFNYVVYVPDIPPGGPSFLGALAVTNSTNITGVVTLQDGTVIYYIDAFGLHIKVSEWAHNIFYNYWVLASGVTLLLVIVIVAGGMSLRYAMKKD